MAIHLAGLLRGDCENYTSMYCNVEVIGNVSTLPVKKIRMEYNDKNGITGKIAA